MADDNVKLEKIAFNSNDFSENLDNFGIEDTKTLNSDGLQKFLLSDPDDVKSLEEEKKEQEKQKLEQEVLKKSEDINKDKDKSKDEKPDGKTALESVLFDGEEGGPKVETNLDSNNKLDNTQSPEEDTYVTLSKDLLRLGVFSKNSDEETEENINIKTPEQFLERFSMEKKKGAISVLDNFLSQFGDDYKDMFNAVFVNGVKPQDYIESFSKIESIKDLDMTQEDNQIRVLKAYYRSLKWDDTKIDNRISKLKDYGDLEDESKSFHEVLLNKEKESISSLETKKIEEKALQVEKDTVYQKSVQRILNEKVKSGEIGGVPLTQEQAQRVFNFMVNKPYRLASGELITEMEKDWMELNRPENHEKKIILAAIMEAKLDLTSIKKATISKKSDELFTLSTKNAKEKNIKKEQKSFFN